MNTDDGESKRVWFAESRGQKWHGEDVAELAANAEEQHVDADVEVRAHKTWRVEDVTGDAAAAAPEQMQQDVTSMNSFASSKTEVFEKIEESHRQCKGSKISTMTRSWRCAYFRMRDHSNTQSVKVCVACNVVRTP